MRGSALTALDLQCNAIGERGAAVLASVFHGDGEEGLRLQSLEIGDNPLSGSRLRSWQWELDPATEGLSRLWGADEARPAAPFLLGLLSLRPTLARRPTSTERLVCLGLRKSYLGPAAARLLLRALCRATGTFVAAKSK